MHKAILTASVLAALPAPASAQATVCHPRPVMVNMLEGKFGETLKAQGTAPLRIAGETFTYAAEIWHDPKDGSFTITRTSPRGTTCVLFGGHSLEFLKAAEPIGVSQ